MSSKIAIVGEAWGEEEARQRLPFVGPSGRELTRMLEEAGISRHECYITNVFNLRPEPNNDIDNLCTSKADGIPGREPLRAGKYIHRKYAPELERLEAELTQLRPNLIIALGGTATWAILGQGGISKIRGTVTGSDFGKVLPTYHPAAILRDWSLRHVTVLDLIKAKRESAFPEVRRPERTVFIEPDLQDLEIFYETYLANAKIISVDIETAGDQITCIGFAPDSKVALVVPFTDPRKPGCSFWPSTFSERCAWEFVKRVCNHPAPKVLQNGLYDAHFLWRRYGITLRNFTEDTMLLHHALQPESEKGLAFLGSVYTNEASWKLMRARGKGTIKRDE